MFPSLWRERTLLWYGHSVFIGKGVLNRSLRENTRELEGKGISSSSVSLQKHRRHSDLDHERKQHIVPLDWNEGCRKPCGNSEVGIMKDHVCTELGLHPKDKGKPKYILFTSSALCLANSCFAPCILATPNYSLLPHLPPTVLHHHAGPRL